MARSVTYLDLPKHYDEGNYFNFLIENFPFICRNIPADLHLDRGLPLTRKLLNQGFLVVERFTVTTMAWLTATENMSVTNDHGYVPYVIITIPSFPH